MDGILVDRLLDLCDALIILNDVVTRSLGKGAQISLN